MTALARLSSRPLDAPPGPAKPPVAAIGTIGFERNAALDFAKGGLVLCMIAYHTLNYFRYDVGLLRHLHFVPASFIFITGFLITHVYRPKLQAGDVLIFRRLFVRGLKVLILFTGLNLIIQTLFATSYNRHLGLELFFSQLDAIYLTGGRHAAVFGVLLPISYLLLLASVLLRTGRLHPRVLPVFAAAGFGLSATLAHLGRLPPNLDLLSLGLVGMVAGFTPRPRLDAIADHLPAIVFSSLVYAVVIQVWYPTYLINAVGVSLSLLLLYSLGQRLGPTHALGRCFALVGNYSLLAYLVQIAALQAIFRIGHQPGEQEPSFAGPFVITTLVTFAVVKVVDRIRARSAASDRVYRLIFA